MQTIFSCLVICFFAVTSLWANGLKVLVLVCASDSHPIWVRHQHVWRSYMHSDPEHITAYFIKSDPTLVAPYLIDGDVIWCKAEDSWIPGMFDKTLLAMECMMPHLDQFDYVLRVGSSSFYYFPGLLAYLSSQSRHCCYCGVIGNSEHGEFVSGAGMILTPDLVKLALQDQRNANRLLGHEDVVFGVFFREHGIFPVSAPREDVLTLEEWNRKKASTAHFHFRVRHIDNSLRATADFQIYHELLKKYYGIDIMF